MVDSSRRVPTFEMLQRCCRTNPVRKDTNPANPVVCMQKLMARPYVEITCVILVHCPLKKLLSATRMGNYLYPARKKGQSRYSRSKVSQKSQHCGQQSVLMCLPVQQKS